MQFNHAEISNPERWDDMPTLILTVITFFALIVALSAWKAYLVVLENRCQTG